MAPIISQIQFLKKSGKSSLSRSEEIRTIYYSMVEMIIQGKYEETAEALNELRDSEFSKDDEIEAVRRFITIRLSIKRGDPGDNISWINFPIEEDSWHAAEKWLVQGHWNYHLQLFPEGIECFCEAEQKFSKLQMHGREFVSAFNAIIGEVSGPKQLLPQAQLEKLRALELRVQLHIDKQDCARVQAMIYRQKAHAFEDLNRFHASLEEISKAIIIFELNGPVSDYHLALLHAADICLDIGDEFKSHAFFEYVIPPVDARVEFPLAFVHWRLGGPVPDKKNFSVLPGGWKDKFEKMRSESDNVEEHSKWIWNQKTGHLIGPTIAKAIIIKPASFEGRLIRLLTQERATKNFLIEALWPEQSEAQLLDNRLHRLISRFNKKLNDTIIYDGKFYTLQIKILLE